VADNTSNWITSTIFSDSLIILTRLRSKHPGIVVQFPSGARDLYLLQPVEIGYGAHLASVKLVPGSISRDKTAGGVKMSTELRVDVRNE